MKFLYILCICGTALLHSRVLALKQWLSFTAGWQAWVVLLLTEKKYLYREVYFFYLYTAWFPALCCHIGMEMMIALYFSAQHIISYILWKIVYIWCFPIAHTPPSRRYMCGFCQQTFTDFAAVHEHVKQHVPDSVQVSLPGCPCPSHSRTFFGVVVSGACLFV